MFRHFLADILAEKKKLFQLTRPLTIFKFVTARLLAHITYAKQPIKRLEIQ